MQIAMFGSSMFLQFSVATSRFLTYINSHLLSCLYADDLCETVLSTIHNLWHAFYHNNSALLLTSCIANHLPSIVSWIKFSCLRSYPNHQFFAWT